MQTLDRSAKNTLRGFALLILLTALPARAQMIETFRADQASRTAEGVMDVFFCESTDGFTFSLYDKRVNPQQRVLHKYEIRGLKAETGKMKRAKEDRTACVGAPDAALTSEAATVRPIPVPEEDDFIWVLQLRLEGNVTLPVVISQGGLPFRVVIEYHQETKEFHVRESH